MTRNNKGLHGFLALLMAALMVLGLCSLGYAADAPEDVEVDESVFSAAPTDTGASKAAEPDEDEVEVVTQKSGETGTIAIEIVFDGEDISDAVIPDNSTITCNLTNEDNRQVTAITITKQGDKWSSAETQVPVGNNSVEILAPTINGYSYDTWEVTKAITNDTYENEDLPGDINSRRAIVVAQGKLKLIIKLKYDKLPTFKLTINKTFEGVDTKDIPADNTIKFKLTPEASTSNPNMEGLTTVEIPIKYTDGQWTSGQIEISEGNYRLSENPVTISGYTPTGWKLEKMTSDGEGVQDELYTTVNEGAPNFYAENKNYVLDIKNNYTKDQSTATQQYTVNYMLVKNGETTQYETVTCDAGADITLMPLPNVNGYTVNGWFEKETSEEIEEGDKENADGNDDAAALNLDEVAQSSLIPDQYGQYAKPGSTIKVDSNRTFYAYALSSGGTVTYSAYLRINKVDAEGNPVAGAGFTVSNGSTTHGSIGLTDEQGQLVMGLLDTGDFTITETTVPEGYVAGEPVTVSVTSANTRDTPCNVTIVNAKAGAQPTVSPTDAPTGEPTATPTDAPTGEPTVSPTDAPTGEPTVSPADEPTARPTAAPTDAADGEDVPKTGDSGLGNLYALMCLSGLSAIALLLTHRRLRRS